MKEIYDGEYYRTDKGTIFGFHACQTDIANDPFSPTVYGDSREEVVSRLLHLACESDGISVRRALRDDFRPFISVDIEKEGEGYKASFRTNYDDRILSSFILHPNDDITRESLYRLFADGLEKDLINEKEGVPDIFRRIAGSPKFNLGKVVPSVVTKDGDMFCGFIVLPEYLETDGKSLTDEGKTFYQASSVRDVLYRFSEYCRDHIEYAFTEYDGHGKALGSMDGFYGSDFERNGMGAASGVSLTEFLGCHDSIDECISSLSDGLSLDDMLGHGDRAAEAAARSTRESQERNEKTI